MYQILCGTCMQDRLIDHCDPILRARYFGVIFDEVPTFEEIKCGTAEIEKIPGVNELFKLAHFRGVSLVHQYDLSWNPIYHSALLIYRKLIDLNG